MRSQFVMFGDTFPRILAISWQKWGRIRRIKVSNDLINMHFVNLTTDSFRTEIQGMNFGRTKAGLCFRYRLTIFSI